MRIGGLQRLTLVDYPGKVAAIVFTQGCNFRCPFCHNPELVLCEAFQPTLPGKDVLHFFERRKKQLQGIVISGGEPTIQKGLVDFVVRIKEMGYAVKIDTNGSHPEVLTSLIDLNLIDYVAMDVKSSKAMYQEAIGVEFDVSKIQQSIDVILRSGLPYQFRTTAVKTLCSRNDLGGINDMIKGANHYVLQSFIASDKIIDPLIKTKEQYTLKEFGELKREFEK